MEHLRIPSSGKTIKEAIQSHFEIVQVVSLKRLVKAGHNSFNVHITSDLTKQIFVNSILKSLSKYFTHASSLRNK